MKLQINGVIALALVALLVGCSTVAKKNGWAPTAWRPAAWPVPLPMQALR